MQQPASTAAATRKGTAFLPALALVVVMSTVTPSSEASARGPELRDLLQEFNAICVRLEASRADLASGNLSDRAFGDRVLELFVRADSINTLLYERFPNRRGPGSAFALDFALRHLMQSLRENYEGIVEGNGYRFLTADVALKAAEAWRSGVTETGSPLP